MGDCNLWANNLPLFDDDKTYKLFYKNKGKELRSSPSNYAMCNRNYTKLNAQNNA